MADHSVLTYLDLVCSTKYATKNSFFTNKKSFEPESAISSPLYYDERMSTSISSGSFDPLELVRVQSQERSPQSSPLPIHTILRGIQDYANARTEADLQEAADFFTPLVLHHWHLSRALNVLRCNNPILKRLDKKRKNIAKITELKLDIANKVDWFESTVATKRAEILKLERENQAIEYELTYEKDNPTIETNEGLQAALVLATLLNLVFREGMSTPWLSEQRRLEVQQQEYRGLLDFYYNISFDKKFDDVFVQHTPTLQRDDVMFVTDTQDMFTNWNPVRLAVQRSRRLSVFLGPTLNNPTYSSTVAHLDSYVRPALGYVNWMFFIPRLMLNFGLIYHHVFNDAELNPIEKKLQMLTRFRAHWTRLWWEVLNDLPWLLNGLTICFILVGGAMSPTGLCLGVLMQSLDLFGTTLRAVIELVRFYSMMSDLQQVGSSESLIHDLRQRINFEQYAFAYNIFHFSVLLASLYMTLPSMAAASLMWPVVGGVCAVLMSACMHLMSNYLKDIRQNYEPKPPGPSPVPQTNSRAGLG
ncbi:MAG: hypothetical protein CK424_00020 [Legionella sp.]|nr:MAG: hypothetical protein CK424_00020 [Legionella sp.]